MRLWPRSLLSRLVVIVLVGLLLANALTLSLLLYERISTARSVMLGNLEYDVATSVAILDRLPASERPAWLARIDRGNYRYLLSAGESGRYPTSWRSKDTARSLEQALGSQYALKINAISGSQEHLQAHLRLHDGAPLTIDITPRPTPIARWLPAVLAAQLLLLLICCWLAVRLAVKPLTRFTRALDALTPSPEPPPVMEESGPTEVQHAVRAFNAMQARIAHHLNSRAQILAAISHDLQTPITRMRLRSEMAADEALRDKLLADLDEMSRLVREGIAYARTQDAPPLTPQRLALHPFIDSLVCDYVDVGKPVTLLRCPPDITLHIDVQALRRILTNLLDNALKFAGKAEIDIVLTPDTQLAIHVLDNGPGIPDEALAAVLEPFYRLETSRNRGTGGTGLGLAIAQQLVSQLGGQLHLSNRPEGGLDVCVLLPR
ncbi:ATP-binding protein [Kosakonia pseudosacchari]|uniref:ATP-binding protein n=1 Tax=Kosakonia pseudosacchari TaxID=1646340 RepID=UPI000A395432|nr:ATP-binding protein [Kosakonia pseudosacchari]